MGYETIKIILITLLAYNFIGLIIYYAEMHKRIVGIPTLLHLVGVYLPIVFFIDAIITYRERREQRKAEDVLHLTQEEEK